jgi:hypothetical protein
MRVVGRRVFSRKVSEDLAGIKAAVLFVLGHCRVRSGDVLSVFSCLKPAPERLLHDLAYGPVRASGLDLDGPVELLVDVERRLHQAILPAFQYAVNTARGRVPVVHNRFTDPEPNQQIVELLWFAGCPNHLAARRLIQDVVEDRAPNAVIREVDATDPNVAALLQFPGSPTIRVNGRDVEPGFEDPGDYTPRCRLYRTQNGLMRIPPRAWVEGALGASSEAITSTGPTAIGIGA